MPAAQSHQVPRLTARQVDPSPQVHSWSLVDLLEIIRRVGETDTISGRLVEQEREDPSWYLQLHLPVVSLDGEAILSSLMGDRAMTPEWECGSGGEEWE
jgi:hypothetical protein